MTRRTRLPGRVRRATPATRCTASVFTFANAVSKRYSRRVLDEPPTAELEETFTSIAVTTSRKKS